MVVVRSPLAPSGDAACCADAHPRIGGPDGGGAGLRVQLPPRGACRPIYRAGFSISRLADRPGCSRRAGRCRELQRRKRTAQQPAARHLTTASCRPCFRGARSPADHHERPSGSSPSTAAVYEDGTHRAARRAAAESAQPSAVESAGRPRLATGVARSPAAAAARARLARAAVHARAACARCHGLGAGLQHLGRRRAAEDAGEDGCDLPVDQALSSGLDARSNLVPLSRGHGSVRTVCVSSLCLEGRARACGVGAAQSRALTQRVTSARPIRSPRASYSFPARVLFVPRARPIR